MYSSSIPGKGNIVYDTQMFFCFFEITGKSFDMKCPGSWCDQATTIMDTMNETPCISQNRMWKRFQAIINSETQNTTQN